MLHFLTILTVLISAITGKVTDGKTCFYQEVGRGGRHDFTVEKREHSDIHHKLVVLADPQLSDKDDLVPLVNHAKDLKQTADAEKLEVRVTNCFGEVFTEAVKL